MKKPLIIAIIFVFALITSAFADTEIKVEVDKTKITTDQTLTYKLTITTTENKIGEPKMPKFDSFNVLSVVRSSNVSFEGGTTKKTLIFAFVLAPTSTGKFKIEPSQVKIGNKTYSTEQFEIEVTQGKSTPKIPQEQIPSQPQENLPQSEEPQVTL